MRAMMYQVWWKYLAAILLLFVIVMGLLGPAPDKLYPIYETVRNLYYHVPMWFVMLFLMLNAMIFGIRFLRNGNVRDDVIALESVKVAVFFGVLGFATGTLWGNYVWGNVSDWIFSDVKVFGALISLLSFLGYLVLRASIGDREKAGRIGAVYSIFAFTLYICFAYVIPRLTDSLHPGGEQNASFKLYDADSNMRGVFYVAIIGWTLLGFWITSLMVRFRFLVLKKHDIL